MSKAAVVYWSGTGNTQAMADQVAAGVRAAGGDADLIQAEEFSPDRMDVYDAVAFGCPSMGSEQLEDTVFEPMFNACQSKLTGKTLGLFGSYGWGGGEWMRDWEDVCRKAGANLVQEGVICNDAPDAAADQACQDLGKALV